MKVFAIFFIGLVLIAAYSLIFSGLAQQEKAECQRWASEDYTTQNVAQWQLEQCQHYQISILK